MTESRVVDVEAEQLPGRASPTKSSSCAWSSGRQLTEVQRQRKRAINNATRRTKRQQRRADQILLLELELQKLRSKSLDGDDDDDEDRGNEVCADGSTGSETEVEGIGQALVVDSVTTRSDPAASLCSERSTQAPATSPTAIVPHSGTASSDTTWTCENISCDLSVLDAEVLLDNSAQVSLPYLMREPAGRDTTEVLNAYVDRSLFSNMSSYSIDDDLYQSILAYGVLYGWDTSIEIHATYCPLLRTIRFLDECFLYDVGPLNRLSIIYVVFKQLQVRLPIDHDQLTSH
jgi:hypothetical protein